MATDRTETRKTRVGDTVLYLPGTGDQLFGLGTEPLPAMVVRIDQRGRAFLQIFTAGFGGLEDRPVIATRSDVEHSASTSKRTRRPRHGTWRAKA